MSKELKAWETIKNNYLLHNSLVGNEIDIIETALKRYIELEEENENLKSAIQNGAILSSWSNTIYQNEQGKKLKALDIIKEYIGVNCLIEILLGSDCPKEKINLLKEVLK